MKKNNLSTKYENKSIRKSKYYEHTDTFITNQFKIQNNKTIKQLKENKTPSNVHIYNNLDDQYFTLVIENFSNYANIDKHFFDETIENYVLKNIGREYGIIEYSFGVPTLCEESFNITLINKIEGTSWNIKIYPIE